MATSLTKNQRVVVGLLEAYPFGYVVDNGGWEWRLVYSPGGHSVRVDGRVVHSLQKHPALVI